MPLRHLTPLQKRAPAFPHAAGGATHGSPQKLSFSSWLHIPCKRFYSLGLIKARTSPGKPGRRSISLCTFKAGVDENYFGDGKVGWEELGWGPGSFKTGSSDKEIASLPQCLHPYCVLVTSKGSFQNSVSKTKSITFIFLNVSMFPCSFCLEIRLCSLQ